MPDLDGCYNLPGKSICIPASSAVDVSALVPIIDHPHFQKLKLRKQLGINYLVFPGAVHTRFEHAIGTLGLTQRLCQVQDIRGETRRYLCAFALLHDVGHGPFSHQIEPIARGDHNSRGIQLLHEMTDELDACGLELQRMVALFRGDEPLAQFVSDRNLGTDKLDYLRRDALHIGFTGTPDIDRMQFYTVLDDGILAIEEKFIEDIKRVQKFYSYLHQHGYLNKTALSVQRLFQRAVQEELRGGRIGPESLWTMTDDELMWWLRRGSNRLGRKLIATFDNRGFHRTVLVIKPVGYGFVERRSGKCIKVREWTRDRIRRFSELYSSSERLLALENALAAELHEEPGTVLFAAMPYFEKLVPRDVRIFSREKGGSFWLFPKDKNHLRSLEADYLRTFAIRVIVPPETRAEMLKKTSALADFIEAQLDLDP